jgi:23S rRNA (cytidine1920-2'-O)/16S rRNA (cytidine1409-2'-O)-methyltransferase
MPPKQRADLALVEQGLAESRSRAQALIMAGQVYAGDKRIDKAGDTIPDGMALRLKTEDHPWVSRGGLKLEKGLSHFAINPSGLVCLDVGASTGGFTDVLLHHGAKKVYAVDVGYGQLARKLRDNPQVVNMERTNARQLELPEPINLIVCDASFIGLETVLQTPLTFAAEGAHLIALIKPQFEVGKGRVGKGGVVRDPLLHEEVCTRIRNWLENTGWPVLGVTESPIKGPAGNIEFLIGAQKTGAQKKTGG